MTSYEDRGEDPGLGRFLGFDHVHLWVGNAVQAAAYYCSRFGFMPVAFRSLETGCRDVMSQVVRQGRIWIVLSSALEPGNESFGRHLTLHGDGVKDVAFTVRDCREVFSRAVARGAVVVREPETLEDTHGKVTVATIQAGFGDTWHSLVERHEYHGSFMPGFQDHHDEDPLLLYIPPPHLEFVDHCVSNNPDGEMNAVVEWYINVLGFHRFWSVDDSQVHTEYSSLRSIVIADYHETIKIPINEPAEGRRKSQIEEYVEYYGGPGIQHIALNTSDIISAVGSLRQRGVGFIQVPSTYYEDLRFRLARSNIVIREDLAEIQKLGILVDFDESGYLLQIFTRPVQHRPTLFFEIIQRNRNSGFGVGNFKSLFEAIERDQAKRGNL
mmetsp:Transcript_3550/g.6724  ORF Transcript_3550/g.6724 Transcript_3550/m.6724 type:complete len:383 (-) Transcript_3550:804-1952(-)|eukprot:CAMPEP_0184682432 /NCGR_PEP_ID=MMETSP0312-20130426/7259_1 /TAXON_ID=31354 /ORGANISM="Compsopogon coeruleus, Strain SAG 36.94" /LENGTH=382 /DNA_ID=CAMNT_0027134109 /DNA_START=57 /DNA_END=1205 /DNA_ORIENTATION=+